MRLFFTAALLVASTAFAQSGLDKSVLDEINLARTDPLRYAKIVQGARADYRGKILRLEGRNIATKEGTAAVDEAIRFLRKQKPLPPLRWEEGLRRAATDLLNDQGPTKKTGHTGSDSSTPQARIERYGKWTRAIAENLNYGFTDARWVVMQLIIDDGVRDRGHRANIFNPAFDAAGAACGPHAGFGSMCVVDFAGGYTETPLSRPGEK